MKTYYVIYSNTDNSYYKELSTNYILLEKDISNCKKFTSYAKAVAIKKDIETRFSKYDLVVKEIVNDRNND